MNHPYRHTALLCGKDNKSIIAYLTFKFGYRCTLELNHKGKHIAECITNSPAHSWKEKTDWIVYVWALEMIGIATINVFVFNTPPFAAILMHLVLVIINASFVLKITK